MAVCLGIGLLRQFSISGTAAAIEGSAVHPAGGSRRLFFFSDFPHPVKCTPNGLIKAGCNTPDSHVEAKTIRLAHDLYKRATMLKVMPKITGGHVN